MAVTHLGSVIPRVRDLEQLREQVTSAETFLIEGHPAALLAFTSSERETAALAQVRKVEEFTAVGPSWIAVAIGADGPASEDSIVGGIAISLHGNLVLGTTTGPPSSSAFEVGPSP